MREFRFLKFGGVDYRREICVDDDRGASSLFSHFICFQTNQLHQRNRQGIEHRFRLEKEKRGNQRRFLVLISQKHEIKSK